MTVDLVSNRENFDNTLPSDDEDESTDDESEDEDDDDANADEAIKLLREELKELQLQSEVAVERQKTADSQLKVLDGYCNSVRAEHNSPEDVSKLLKMYQTERMEAFSRHAEAKKDSRKWRAASSAKKRS